MKNESTMNLEVFGINVITCFSRQLSALLVETECGSLFGVKKKMDCVFNVF